MEEGTMTDPMITRKDLLAFPRPVQDVVMHLVKEHGVRFRMLDGRHVFLYGPDGSTRKAGSQRKADDSVKNLKNWARKLGCDHLS